MPDRRVIVASPLGPDQSPAAQTGSIQQIPNPIGSQNYTKRLTKPHVASKVYHMVDYRSEPLDYVFKALGDPTRRRMVGSLSAKERSVSELAEPLKMTLAAASKHVRVLERAGLVRRSKRGRTHYIRLDPGPLATAHSWLDVYRRLSDEQFDKLDAYLAGKKKRGEKPDA
jgi:DNA-binding transcriptional ArsR family regulator